MCEGRASRQGPSSRPNAGIRPGKSDRRRFCPWSERPQPRDRWLQPLEAVQPYKGRPRSTSRSAGISPGAFERRGSRTGARPDGGAAVALFEFLGQYPLALLTSLVALFLIFIFFVAEADAGTIVLASMSTGGSGLAPKRPPALITAALP